MKKSYCLWILILLVVGCRQEEITEEGTRYPVSFNLPAIEMLTRASDGTTGTLGNGTTLTVAAYNQNTGNLVDQCNYTVNASGTMDPTTPGAKMYLSAGVYDFCTISPAQTLSADGKSATIAKEVDLLGSVTRALMLSEATTIDLDDLSHLASQIKFTFRVVHKKDKADWTKFQVKNVKIGGLVSSFNNNLQLPENKLVVPLAGETGKFESTETEIDNSEGAAFDYSETISGKSGSFYNIQKNPLLVFPRAADPFKVTVTVDEEIKTTGETPISETPASGTKQYSATISHVAFEPGKQYHFIVNFGWEFMNFTVLVADWDYRDNGQGDVGSGEQEISSTFTVDEWGTAVDLGGNLGGAE